MTQVGEYKEPPLKELTPFMVKHFIQRQNLNLAFREFCKDLNYKTTFNSDINTIHVEIALNRGRRPDGSLEEFYSDIKMVCSDHEFMSDSRSYNTKKKFKNYWRRVKWAFIGNGYDELLFKNKTLFKSLPLLEDGMRLHMTNTASFVSSNLFNTHIMTPTMEYIYPITPKKTNSIANTFLRELSEAYDLPTILRSTVAYDPVGLMVRFKKSYGINRPTMFGVDIIKYAESPPSGLPHWNVHFKSVPQICEICNDFIAYAANNGIDFTNPSDEGDVFLLSSYANRFSQQLLL